jgi:RNA polymerase sigma-70 factor (ECF subfamily)
MAWKRFYPVVEMTLRRMLGPDGDIEDLAQDVFLRFFRKVTGLKKVESLRSFVMAIAIRRAQEEIRRRRVRRWFAPITTQLLALPPTIEMDPEAREVIVHLYRIIDRLRLKDRNHLRSSLHRRFGAGRDCRPGGDLGVYSPAAFGQTNQTR